MIFFLTFVNAVTFENLGTAIVEGKTAVEAIETARNRNCVPAGHLVGMLSPIEIPQELDRAVLREGDRYRLLTEVEAEAIIDRVVDYVNKLDLALKLRTLDAPRGVA